MVIIFISILILWSFPLGQVIFFFLFLSKVKGWEMTFEVKIYRFPLINLYRFELVTNSLDLLNERMDWTGHENNLYIRPTKTNFYPHLNICVCVCGLDVGVDVSLFSYQWPFVWIFLSDQTFWDMKKGQEYEECDFFEIRKRDLILTYRSILFQFMVETRRKRKWKIKGSIKLQTDFKSCFFFFFSFFLLPYLNSWHTYGNKFIFKDSQWDKCPYINCRFL